MKLLLRINRKNRMLEFFAPEFRNHPQLISTKAVGLREDEAFNYAKDGEFFVVDERDVNAALRYFAGENPGCEVEIYTMTQSGICPPGEFVQKKISKDGVLPA